MPREKRQELENLFEKLAQEFIQERLDRGENVEFYAQHKDWYRAYNLILDIIELNDIYKAYKKVLKNGKDRMVAYMQDQFSMGYASWNSKVAIYTLDYVMKQLKINKGQVRYFIQSEKDFEIK